MSRVLVVIQLRNLADGVMLVPGVTGGGRRCG